MSIDTATGTEAPSELSSARVKSIFSHIAPRYERFNAISSFGAYKAWLSKMVKAMPFDAGAHVLDVAGGTGDVTFAVARKKKPAHIMCTDLVPEMLEVARRHYSDGAAGEVPVTFKVADAQALPFEDERFDAVTVAYGVRNMPDRPLALTEMLRVLKPGGSLTCLDFSTPANTVWRGLYGVYLRYVIPFWGQLIAGEREGFVYLGDSIRAFPNQRALATLMEDAGFTQVSWQNYTGGIAAIHVAFKPE